MSTLLQSHPTTNETDPQTLTDWKVLVFELDVCPGARHLTFVKAHTESEATRLVTTEAESTYPEVKSWGVWYIRRVHL